MRLALTFLLLFVSIATFSQRIQVLDKETGKPINNVNIFNEAETLNIHTDEKGWVDLGDVNKEEYIIFSHISYSLFRIQVKKLPKNGRIFLNKQSEKLDEVVLSVFRSEAKTNRIPEQVAVINAEQIQQVSPQTSADLLAVVPGIKVQKSQFGGGSPVLRGMESNRVLLVVDGVRMNNAIYRKGHLQNSITIAPNQLDRTEIVFGPSSVIYGSDALGGVIHYYTKTPSLSNVSKVNTQIFNRVSTINNELTTNVSIELQNEKWASYTSFSRSEFGDLHMGKRRSHGFEDWGKVFNYSSNTDDFFAENQTVNSNPNIQRNTGYSQIDLLQKFFVPLSEKVDLKVNIQYSESVAEQE